MPPCLDLHPIKASTPWFGILLKPGSLLKLGSLTCIGSCASMEREWLRSLDSSVTKHFRFKRYLDDILLLANKNSKIDTDSLIKDFESSTCYMPPLKLEAADQGTFLETFIYNKGDKMEWRLKNKNEPHEVQKFYNYQHKFPQLPSKTHQDRCCDRSVQEDKSLMLEPDSKGNCLATQG